MKRDLIVCMALIWVTGPSGAGKSTIGTFMRDKHQVAHILTHDMDMEIFLSESSSFTQQKNGNPETRVQCHSKSECHKIVMNSGSLLSEL